MKIKVNCDCCNKSYSLTAKQKYDLELAGFIIYCDICASKMKLNKAQAFKDGIKIYKM